MPIYDEAPILSRDRHGLSDLHHGVAIAMAETPFDTIGVDTEEDLAEAAARLGRAAQ